MKIKRFGCVLILSLFSAVSVGQVGFAQAPTTIAGLPGKASTKQLSEFKAAPGGLLKAFPIGGAQLSSLIKSLVLADPSVVDELAKLAPSGSALQRSAIGTGIGQAAKAISPADKALADDIARKIAIAGVSDLLAGYAAGQSDVQTLAVGGGAAGGGFGVGGPTGGFPLSGGVGRPSTGPGSVAFTNSGQLPRNTYAGGGVNCTESFSPRRRC